MSVLLFDAGGVLVELGPPPLKSEWLGEGRTVASVWGDWLHMPASRQFESGQCDEQVFAHAMINALHLNVSSDRFIQEFSAWPVGAYPGTVAWLQGLSEQHTLALLSNTNELHWQRMRREMGLGSVMQHYFLSHRMGLVKPDDAIFLKVIEALGVPAQAIEFFDDNTSNVAAAKRLGLSAHHVVGPAALREAVASL